jgi:hypothetical protein
LLPFHLLSLLIGFKAWFDFVQQSIDLSFDTHVDVLSRPGLSVQLPGLWQESQGAQKMKLEKMLQLQICRGEIA